MDTEEIPEASASYTEESLLERIQQRDQEAAAKKAEEHRQAEARLATEEEENRTRAAEVPQLVDTFFEELQQLYEVLRDAYQESNGELPYTSPGAFAVLVDSDGLPQATKSWRLRELPGLNGLWPPRTKLMPLWHTMIYLVLRTRRDQHRVLIAIDMMDGAPYYGDFSDSYMLLMTRDALAQSTYTEVRKAIEEVQERRESIISSRDVHRTIKGWEAERAEREAAEQRSVEDESTNAPD